MAHDLDPTEALIRRLGSLVSAREAVTVTALERGAIGTAVAEASFAVARVRKGSAASTVEFARRQIEMAEEVIATFDHTLAESRRLQAAALPLCERARALVEEARRLGSSASSPSQQG
jgi:hypothetical protein